MRSAKGVSRVVTPPTRWARPKTVLTARSFGSTVKKPFGKKRTANQAATPIKTPPRISMRTPFRSGRPQQRPSKGGTLLIAYRAEPIKINPCSRFSQRHSSRWACGLFGRRLIDHSIGSLDRLRPLCTLEPELAFFGECHGLRRHRTMLFWGKVRPQLDA